MTRGERGRREEERGGTEWNEARITKREDASRSHPTDPTPARADPIDRARFQQASGRPRAGFGQASGRPRAIKGGPVFGRPWAGLGRLGGWGPGLG